ncbi:carbohydrate ABC transporter permease [Kibdelosporangium philippinense]|uniref:Carbohydrate ABC transporter permease n=1 Tax=Kibdelosporangium philippinense TaxID=211113 RepID=A0ABS8Z4K5_9PSEU|nr:carbohydrate ABC transporter permease [Kibdelosporangium philippinense]MCE7002765.1 carbohydrate ABC transporter permease [Kibdelosporangium philippinense]
MKARVIAYVLLGVYALISLYPFAWMVSGAFKDRKEVLEGGNLIPDRPTLDTFATTWGELDFLPYFVNSLLVTVATVIGVLVVYSLASYAFAVLKFPGSKLIYAGFVSLLFVPGITVLLPVVILQQELQLLGTQLGLVLPFVNGTAPLAILLLTNAFRSVPSELRESARCDGASELRTFLSIYLPVSRPALIAIALLTAVPTWNEYVLSRVSLNDAAVFTLPLGLQSLTSTTSPQYNVIMAASLIIVLPVIVLFVLLQRYFVNGLVGAVKG